MSSRFRVISTLAIATCVFLISCASMGRDIEVVKEFPSPSGALKAVLYELIWIPGECSLNLSVLAREDGPEEAPGNAVAFGNHHGVTGNDYRGDLPVQVSWANDSLLRVAVDARLQVVREFNSVNGVAVSVQQVKAGQLTKP